MNELLLDEVLEKSNVTPEGRVLDVGCGTGDLAVKLAKRGYSVTAIDGSKIALEKAIERIQRARLENKIEILRADIEYPAEIRSLAGRRYDLITCKLVLAFLQDKSRFFEWVKCHLEPAGAFVVMTPVLHLGRAYDKRLQAISIAYEPLLGLLHRHFSQVDEVHADYFDDLGDRRTLVLHA